MTVLKFDIIFC